MGAQPSALVEVHFLNFPLDVYHRAQEHSDGLMREFSLIAGGDGAAIPRRLLTLAEQLEHEYGDYTAGYEQQLDAAIARGDVAIDIQMTVPPQARDAALELDRMLAEADEYCRSGDLLSLVPPPELLAFRQWYISEIVRQIDGEPPTPWDAFAAAG